MLQAKKGYKQTILNLGILDIHSGTFEQLNALITVTLNVGQGQPFEESNNDSLLSGYWQEYVWITRHPFRRILTPINFEPWRPSQDNNTRKHTKLHYWNVTHTILFYIHKYVPGIFGRSRITCLWRFSHFDLCNLWPSDHQIITYLK